MQRKSHRNAVCPVARSMERVGDAWSVLILREAFYGATRFDAFQKALGIAPNMLTRRLNALVDDGLMVRRPYSTHPPRDDYVLTALGRDFRPVLLTLLAWGNRHFPGAGETMRLVELSSGRPVRVTLIDADTGERITEARHRIAPGPAASEAPPARLAAPATAPLPASGRAAAHAQAHEVNPAASATDAL